MSAMGAIGAIGAIGAEKNSACRYLADGFSIRPGEGQEELFGQAKKRMKRAGVDTRSLHFRLFKRSVDARRRDDIRLICTVLVESDEPLSARVCARAGLKQLADGKPVLHVGTEPMERPPLVVGMGPAGLFAALLLAQNGYRPVIIDRGDAVSERVAKVELFRASGELDGESNVQFGAGGAGTFSDGKLVTRIHDPRCRFVLETFHRFGAPDEILTLAKPHIGTDILRTVVARMLAEIERLGGEVRYRCRAEGLRENADGSVTVRTPQGEEAFSAVVLAVGHSARDTYEELIAGGFAVEAKPISVGVRAEHLQADIDRALYGDFAGHLHVLYVPGRRSGCGGFGGRRSGCQRYEQSRAGREERERGGSGIGRVRGLRACGRQSCARRDCVPAVDRARGVPCGRRGLVRADDDNRRFPRRRVREFPCGRTADLSRRQGTTC